MKDCEHTHLINEGEPSMVTTLYVQANNDIEKLLGPIESTDESY